MAITHLFPSHVLRPSGFLFVLIFIAFIIHLTTGHQSISYPYPISNDVACRISPKQFCPGPCPKKDLRRDKTPNNPSVTVRRGDWITFNLLVNNHRGGFNRWTLVHVKDMHNHARHRENAFLYTCADVGLSTCKARFRRRDCRFDLKNQYLTNTIQIPTIYADGVYVLGWVWYGGGEEYGAFGDYYDCVYLRVKGGPKWYAHRPIFKPGKSATGFRGMCRATVNKIGVCWKEPCPGGARKTHLKIPLEFDGRTPDLVPASRFRYPYFTKERGPRSPFVKAMTVRSSIFPTKIYTGTKWTRSAYIFLRKSMRVTVTCEDGGEVRCVVFYVNGQKGRTDCDEPYTIAGDWRDGTGKINYAPWTFGIDRTVATVSCKAYGWDGTEHWENMELSTDY